MAKLTRESQKIFAGASNVNEKASFGSMKSGTPVYSEDLSTLQTADYEQGWQNALLTGKAPFLEEMNGVQYGLSKQIAYILQDGIPEWLSTETYYKDNYCKVGHDIFYSNSDNNIGNNPSTDNVNWTHAGNYETATSTTSGLTKLYASTGNNTDGTMTQQAITSALPSQATASDLGTVKLYAETGSNEDGTMTQQGITTALNSKQDTLIAGENITIVNNVISSTGGGGGSASWGSITGTISNQTDLINILNQKENCIIQKREIGIGGILGTIKLNLNNSFYYRVPTLDGTNIDIDISELGTLTTNDIITFELYIKMSSVKTLIWASNIHWLNDETPDMSIAGNYYLVFRSIDQGTNWIANIQGRWNL